MDALRAPLAGEIEQEGRVEPVVHTHAAKGMPHDGPFVERTSALSAFSALSARARLFGRAPAERLRSGVAPAPAPPTIDGVDLRQLRSSLVAAQIVGVATLLRSIAYDRWITVLAAVLLLIGATAAQRGRTWGVALAFAAAVAFPVAWMIGIAPPWFALVGIVGSLPFAIASRAFARFDKGATTVLALIAMTAGALGALAWKEYAWSIFTMFPAFRPSIEAQHGLALTAVVASAALAMRFGRSALGGTGGEQHVRIAQHVRVGEVANGEVTETAAADEADEAESHERRRAGR